MDLNLFKRFNYLTNFTAKTLKRFKEIVEPEEVSHKGVLFNQGDKFTHFYLLVLGEFEQLWVEKSALSKN